MNHTTFLYFFIISVILLSCAQPNGKTKDQAANEPIKLEPLPDEAVATYAAGCFWCTEEIFESLLGVREVIPGYAGGKAEDADYDKVSSGATDHAESVQVYYDPVVLPYKRLTEAFFAGHDPTTLNRQGPDAGRQYRSIAFYRNEEEKQIILNEIHRIDSSGMYPDKVITEVTPFTTFYPAEAYHQNYITHHPNDPYVRGVSIPRFEKFKKQFEGKLKSE